MIKMLYINGNSSIKLSNGTSPRFFLNRGVRQGCPVSPYLFLIATQFLSMHIKSSHLKGITIGNNTIIISQLADDTTLFLYDSSQIPVALSILRPFSEASGLHLNINKCELLSIKNCSVASIEGIAVKNSLTYLGIQITKDEYRCSANFKPIITKTQRRCNCWLQRDLSLKGRTLLTKAEGLSRLAYAAQSLFVDKPTCKIINNVLIHFSGLCTLLKNCRYSSTVTASFLNPCDTSVGQICFSASGNKKYKIRSLFLENLISAPHVKLFWNNLFDDLNWKKVWSLQQKFFLTNKVKEVSFKLIHRFYPVKKFIQKFRADVELSCSFCLNADETVEHLFWSCQYTQEFWDDIDAFVKLKILPEFSIQMRNIICGYFDPDPTKEIFVLL